MGGDWFPFVSSSFSKFRLKNSGVLGVSLSVQIFLLETRNLSLQEALQDLGLGSVRGRE